MKNRFLKCILTLLPLILLLDVYAYADPPLELREKTGGGYAASGQIEGVGYSAEIFDAGNGLPTSDANYILGARDGYIWIGGYSGIIRYDGSVFERMDTSYGLTSGRCIYEDSRGRIWVGTNDNGVVVLDKGECRHFTFKDGLPSSSIRSFAEDNNGNVYIGSTAGVSYVDKDMILHNIHDERTNEEIVLKMESDSLGKIYGQTRNGIIFTIENQKISELYTGIDLNTEKINTFLADPYDPGKVYLGTDSGVLYYGNLGDDSSKLKKISVSPAEDVHWMSYACGRVWVASPSIAGYLDENGKFKVLDNIPMNSAIEMMTSDYQGNMWFASATLGVMKIVANNFVDICKVSRLPEEVVNATCLHDDLLYIGTDNGLRILNKDYEQVEDELTEYIGHARIRCIMEDSNNNLWISVFNEKLGVVVQSESGEIKSYTVKDGLPSDEIRCTVETDDGSILVGTNGGLSVIKDGKVVKTVSDRDGLKNTVFLTVSDGERDEIYAGTDGDGIYVISDSGIRKIGREQDLTSDVILRIKKDEERGVYWIITSNSIEYMKDDYITNVTSFPYNNNYDAYFDDNGYIWILSSYGIYSVKADEMIKDDIKDYRLYTNANGVTSTPTSNAYSALDPDGNLYISGRSGVSRVNINRFFEKTVFIKTGVRSIQCDGKEVVPDGEGTYTIPPSSGRIQITPCVFDYTMTNPTVRVFLEGGDDEGITVQRSKLSTLEYTRLKYGKYVLHIQILGNGIGEIIQDDTFLVTKQPRLVELVVVRVILLLLLALVAGLIVWRVMTGTIIRRQYEQIQEAKDEAERANIAKSCFLANMSHEIRTPINTIMGMDEMILREDAADVPQGYFMSIINYALDIRTATESLLGLINDLLDMSKIESGKMHLVEQEYDICDLLRSIVTMIRVRSTEKELKFDVVIDEMLPSRMYGDSGKIKQIVLNLLTNAVKYTEEGGFTLSVTMEGRDDDSCDIRYSVKDTGIGVKEEDMERLFTAYERLDEEKNSGIQGTGLGLDISRRFAELMGGKLWCESVYGKGSEFILTVKQKITDKAPIGKFTEHSGIEAKGPYVPQFIAPDADVLVVDDNPMNLNVIKGLLKATKMFVTTASSGEECLEMLKDASFNIVLLDHMMPGMDGVETVAEIRKDYPDLPVYALTANATAGEEFYTSRGFDGYLAKPIDSLTLEKTIMRHLPEELMMKPVEGEHEEEETLPEDLLWLNDVEGISVEDGVKASGGVSTFIQSLNLFYDTIESNSDVIRNAYDEDDIRLYTVKVHALKSSARIIGAGDLSKLAESLENAGNKGDRDFIDANADKLLKDYSSYKDKLSRLKEDKGDDDRELIPEEDLLDAYGALKDVAAEMDYDAAEMILEQLKEYRLPDGDDKKVEELSKKLKALDWDGMEELLSDRQRKKKTDA